MRTACKFRDCNPAKSSAKEPGYEARVFLKPQFDGGSSQEPYMELEVSESRSYITVWVQSIQIRST